VVLLMARELELKVELSHADAARLSGAQFPDDDLTIGAPATKKLRSVYFDTPDYDLHAAGLTLRLRREEGSWVQTVKAAQCLCGGLSNPIEVETRLEASEPDIGKIADEGLKRGVEEALMGKSLHPIFETRVRRTTRNIKTRSSVVELAVDEGEVVAASKGAELREVELELKSGSAEGLLLAAEKLFGDRELKLSTRSKAERGYLLALGNKGAAPGPQKARPIKIKPGDSCAKAFAAILASVAEQVHLNRHVVLETDDPEGAHQLRIGLRRLRSVLQALRPLTRSPSLKDFEQSARDMGRCVGNLRDADVLISAIVAPMEAAATDKTGFAELNEALAHHRIRKRDEVRAALESPAWTRLQLYLTLWPRTLEEGKKLRTPVGQYSRKVLNKTWRKAGGYGKRLDELSAEERHEMRKTLKKLRYEAEFFAPIYKGRTTAKFIKRLKDLQDIFGYMVDVRMAPKIVEIQQQTGLGCTAARAAGYTVGRHEAEAAYAWKHAGAAWKELKQAGRFWE
jgi:inorganic triphosphatase YgiF